uniref:DNA packaging terminase subunit 2 n=1 Tax=Cardioderma bat herpesvirus TaxID=3141914 RepID=A0AAU7E0R9_9VIRU
MEVECLKYCDPSIVAVDSAPFKRNALMVVHLHRVLYPALVRQNEHRTSTLTLYMEMLLRCLYEDVVIIDGALEEFLVHRNRAEYYRKVLRLDKCDGHDTLSIRFTPKVVLTVTLSTLNEVERFLCKINCVYGVLDPERGLEICRRLLALLGRLCGISPVAAPETYAENHTCLQCYEELAAVPNQGRSIARRLQGLLCDHITVRRSLVRLETDIRTTEQDINEEVGRTPRMCGIISAIKNLSCLSPASHNYINEAEEALKAYNLFTDIPERIYSLSDFTYWSKTSEVIVKHVGVTMRQLNLHHGLCKTLRNELSRYLYGEDVDDLFNTGEGRFAEDERLYAGSPFASPEKVVDLITTLSIKAFEGNPIFNRLHENNEVYVKIRSLIEEIRRPDAVAQGKDELGKRPMSCVTGTAGALDVGGARGAEDAERDAGAEGGAGAAGTAEALEVGDPFLKNHDVTREVNIRKRAYLRKVSEAGYNKVMRCIKTQESLITKLVNVNLTGTVCFEALSKLMNGLLVRRRYLDEDAALDVNDLLSYDDHLYVVNNIKHRKLPVESLPLLGQQIYGLLNGPVFTHHEDFYPLPNNIDMAYACDNAGMLPHIKEELVRCAEGTVYPGEWMVTRYAEFFNFDAIDDLNALQKEQWLHVRELVLSVALYNEVFGKSLTVHRVDVLDREPDEGIVLTYNVKYPLILKTRGYSYRSTDLYLLLYLYLRSERTAEAQNISRSGDGPITDSRSAGSGFRSERQDGQSHGPGGCDETQESRGSRRKRRYDAVSLSELVRYGDVSDVLVPDCLL